MTNDSERDLLIRACRKAGVEVQDVGKWVVTREGGGVEVRLVFRSVPIRPNLTVSFSPEELQRGRS